MDHGRRKEAFQTPPYRVAVCTEYGIIPSAPVLIPCFEYGSVHDLHIQ